jgi:hypothetical protein
MATASCLCALHGCEGLSSNISRPSLLVSESGCRLDMKRAACVGAMDVTHADTPGAQLR